MPALSGSFHLGYPRMDRDHEILFDLFRELEAAARTRADDGLQSIFIRIRDHLRAQFDNKSSLMEAHSYPGQSEHEQEHQEIRAQLECVSIVLRRGRIAAAGYGLKMVAMTVVSHVNAADRELARYLLGRDASVRQYFGYDAESCRLVPVPPNEVLSKPVLL